MSRVIARGKFRPSPRDEQAMEDLKRFSRGRSDFYAKGDPKLFSVEPSEQPRRASQCQLQLTAERRRLQQAQNNERDNQ